MSFCNCRQPGEYCSHYRLVLWGQQYRHSHNIDCSPDQFSSMKSICERGRESRPVTLGAVLDSLEPFLSTPEGEITAQSAEIVQFNDDKLPCGCVEPGICSYYGMDFTGKKNSWQLSHGVKVKTESFLLTKKLLLDFISANPGVTPMVSIGMGEIQVTKARKPCGCLGQR